MKYNIVAEWIDIIWISKIPIHSWTRISINNIDIDKVNQISIDKLKKQFVDTMEEMMINFTDVIVYLEEYTDEE